MFHRLKRRRELKRASAEYERTKALADKHDLMVCATVSEDGKPLYFKMSPTATEAQIAEKAFEVRYGRSMSPLEKELAQMLNKS